MIEYIQQNFAWTIVLQSCLVLKVLVVTLSFSLQKTSVTSD